MINIVGSFYLHLGWFQCDIPKVSAGKMEIALSKVLKLYLFVEFSPWKYFRQFFFAGTDRICDCFMGQCNLTGSHKIARIYFARCINVAKYSQKFALISLSDNNNNKWQRIHRHFYSSKMRIKWTNSLISFNLMYSVSSL